MATNAFVDVDLPEAAHLADLTGIRYDLISARSFAQWLKTVYEAERPDWELVDAFSTAILVRYSRPFTTGVRKWSREEALKALSGPQRQKHDWLRVYRDKHIAHSVNAFEQNQPVARYWVERVQEEGITSVECNHKRFVGLSPANLEDVIELTTTLLSYVDGCLEDEKARVLEIVRTMPLDEVLSKATKEPAISNLKKIDKPRARR